MAAHASTRTTETYDEMLQSVVYNVDNMLNALSRLFLEIPELSIVSQQKLMPTGGGLNITGVVLAAQEEAHTQKETKSGDKVNLPTNDITMMHEAIPFLPVPVALLCFFLNIFLPGTEGGEMSLHTVIFLTLLALK
ncbi:hypothetical protein TELCIR_15302 [Teladorsagia circumcincta]|uniref:Uncharacterized protein n=1 Tax=Teladorsagia circumcincta TaxID=45464 RepID=A0A2G9TYN9_TELCI|nr:hypothetical protein TELCIR_15302 [Teladorsagia circumcincta]